MTIAREWAIPAALGLLVAGAFWAADGDDEPRQLPEGNSTTTTTPSASTQPLLTPFMQAWGPEASNTTFLLVAPRGQAVADAHLNATGHDPSTLDWTGGNAARGIEHKVAFFERTHVSVVCSDGALSCPPTQQSPLPFAWAKPDEDLGPRLGRDGYNATRATIYVFDSRGLLAATNDVPGNWSRFAGQPSTVDSELWYLGDNDTAPNGTRPIPTFAVPLVQKLRPLMEGLAVGGVVSAQSNAYSSLYGTLFITARIDELAYAP